MATTTEYLNQLQKDLNNIKENYIDKGIDISQDATFTDIATASNIIIKEPTTSISITENGNIDVKNYATANVSVSGGGGGDEYFYTDNIITPSASVQGSMIANIIKKIPDITLKNNVTSLASAFHSQYCPKVDEIGKINNVTDKLTLVNYTFYGQSRLKKLDLSNWDTSNVMSMVRCFYYCSALEELYLDSWSFNSVTDKTGVFSDVGSSTNPTKVYVKDEEAQQWILNLGTGERPTYWSAANVIIAGSAQDTRNK